MADSTLDELHPNTKDEFFKTLVNFGERIEALEDQETEQGNDLRELKRRLAAAPLHQSNGKGAFHALFLNKEGKASREKVLQSLLTLGSLVLIPWLISRGVDPVIVSGLGLWFAGHSTSKWRERHQRDLPVDAPER